MVAVWREDMVAVYISQVHITRHEDGLRTANLPLDTPVVFGVHDGIAEHYKKEPGTYEPHSATLDYVVAAAAG